MRDFVYHLPCGCRIVFEAATRYRLTHSVACPGHERVSLLRGDMLDVLGRQALVAWVHAGGPDDADEGQASALVMDELEARPALPVGVVSETLM